MNDFYLKTKQNKLFVIHVMIEYQGYKKEVPLNGNETEQNTCHLYMKMNRCACNDRKTRTQKSA